MLTEKEIKRMLKGKRAGLTSNRVKDIFKKMKDKSKCKEV